MYFVVPTGCSENIAPSEMFKCKKKNLRNRMKMYNMTAIKICVY